MAVLGASRVDKERPQTSGTFCCRRVVEDRPQTSGRVVVAGGVEQIALNPVAVLLLADGVALERSSTVGRVVAAGGVANERTQNRWPCSSFR